MLHSEIKSLKANLIRNDFTRYTNSREFGLVLMENDYDDLFKKFVAPASGLNSSAKINAYVELLNYILLEWIRFGPNSTTANQLSKNFNQIILTTIESYIEWAEEITYSDQLLDVIGKLGPIDKKTINSIKTKLKNKGVKITEVKAEKSENKEHKSNLLDYSKVDYAIITALEEDEMEKVLPLLAKTGEVTDSKNFIEYGHLKKNPSKKVAYASQHKTGMVDASILATELIIRFNPRYLIMTGVLGGKPNETNIGDVVVATKVFEIDRGKITDLGFKKEISTVGTDSKEIKKIHRSKKDIENYINSKDETRSENIKIHFGSIACVNQVIDIEGFFESSITSVERKAIALEMESYAVVRACQLCGDKTIPLIIKSVMDNTKSKSDNAKPYAAWTSARALEYILEKELI